MNLPIWTNISMACRFRWDLLTFSSRVFGEDVVFLCETISVNLGVTVWNDFVPKHDLTSVTVSIQSEDIFKKTSCSSLLFVDNKIIQLTYFSKGSNPVGIRHV